MKIREFKIFDRETGDYIESCNSNDYITTWVDCIEVYCLDKTTITRKNINDVSISDMHIQIEEERFDPELFNICADRKGVASVKIIGTCQKFDDKIFNFELIIDGDMRFRDFRYNVMTGNLPRYSIVN